MSNKSTEQSIKSRLKNISKERQIPFNSLLETLLLERFLVRIARSNYKNRLIFKGGMCLAQFIKLGRETRDLDFLLTHVQGSIPEIEQVITEIALTAVDDDFVFSMSKVSELSVEHKKYPGYRITLQGELGQIKKTISLDIGVGDVVRPRPLEVELMRSKKPLFEENISLSAYPPEYIFSEKLEAILYHGELGSRMKDYYDCYRMVDEAVLDMELLKEALLETTSNRGTKLRTIPENTEPFTDLWSNFLNSNELGPLDMNKAINVVNTILQKII
ncbi:MAG: nucleotidyl transferase AbiEii/AbiGii toxin family protein [Bacteriovoracaceae bacterium]|nr:nucleotidyl transferase AbiEii/AbiGii toxin family protein [Bacteriovoracaceae bacterium]